MPITAVKDPSAWTIFEGEGSNQTRLGRVTQVAGSFVFTPDPGNVASAALMREIADRLDALNAP